MCTVDVNSLADFNVNNTKQTSTFTLHASSLFSACQSQGPLPFCLLPPSPRLETMCAGTLSDYFDNVLNGSIKKVQDLPLVWDAPMIGTEEDPPWITLDVNANQLYPDGFYLGLQPMPLFQEVAMSNNFQNFWGVSGGKLFELESSGFIENNHPEINGTDNMLQSVQLNADGSMGVVMFSNKLFFWQQGAFVDQSEPAVLYSYARIFVNGPSDTTTRLIIVARTSTGFTQWCYAGTSTFTLVRQNNVTFPQANFALQWVALTSDTQRTLVAIDSPNLSFYDVYVCSNIADGVLPQDRWNVTRFLPTTSAGRFNAVCRGSMSSTQLDILYLNQTTTTLGRVLLNPFIVTAAASLVSPSVTWLTEPFSRTSLAYTTVNNIIQYGANPTSTATLQVADANSFGTSGRTSTITLLNFFPDASQVFVIFADRSFWNNSNITAPAGWTNDYNLFTNQDAHVSDFGLFGLTPAPVITWFFGFFTVSIVNAGDIIVSRHEYFRLVVDDAPIVHTDQFTHISAKLQQTNFNNLLRSGVVQFANTSNLQVLTNVNTVTLWQRATTDAFSDDKIVITINPEALLTRSTAFVTQNGLYVCYLDSEMKSLRVAYNVYNNGAFTDYCSVSTERQSRALQRQSDFCWSSLFVPSLNTFTDNRCTCIAGPRFLDIAFPGQSFSSVTTARLEHNFPCIYGPCQEPLATPEDTNVYNAVTKQCQDAPLTVCSSLIIDQPGGALKLSQGVITQKCGASVFSCGQDNDCPLGSSCVNGVCVLNCTTNTDCITGSTCTNGICINPHPVPANKPSNFSKVALIVIASLAGLALIALLLILLVKTSKK